jgi:hypothetical protein
MEYRSTEQIASEIGAATTSGDVKRLRELATELQESLRKAAQAEVDARNAAKAEHLDPIKQRFVQAVERQDGLLDFVRECGGVLSFSYTMSAEGSEEGPVIAVNADSRAISSATRAPRAASSNGGGGGRGKVYVVNGSELGLSEAFEAVATAEDKASKQERMDAASTDKSRNSAGWAVMSRTVLRAVEEGRATIKE